jgi:hypothetical protein
MLIDKLFFVFSTTVKWLPQAITSCYHTRNIRPVHLLFCMVDHYEPGTGNVSLDTARERVDLLLSRYPQLADKHRDSSGYCPRRTWFFPPHYHENYFLRDLVSLCAKGYGEIELHLHHGKQVPDTSENLEYTILQCIKEYSYFGIFGSQQGVKKYAFIHGDWALDNSQDGLFCGVNNEIEILRKTGCFADFTFPSLYVKSNPSQINSIYYARDIPDRPKSYDTGIRVKVSGKTQGDLMMIQGPLFPFFKNSWPWSFRVEGDGATLTPEADKRQVDAWVRTRICIEGKEEWLIIKTHTHGAVYSAADLGDEMDEIYNYLESKYNDGHKYILHYVTARELYNIIKAAEAGEPLSNPDQYRDYLVTHPVYDSTPDIPEASPELKSLIAKTYRS